MCLASLALSVLSFAAGLAGDFSTPPPVSGTSVVVRIPPEIPADSVRAMALPRTASALARTHVADRRTRVEEAPVLAPLGASAGMIFDHEIAHSAGDTAYAAEDIRDRLG